jgi:hypothetical protein
MNRVLEQVILIISILQMMVWMLVEITNLIDLIGNLNGNVVGKAIALDSYR